MIRRHLPRRLLLGLRPNRALLVKIFLILRGPFRFAWLTDARLEKERAMVVMKQMASLMMTSFLIGA